MNAYEQKQADRKSRIEARAEALNVEANRVHHVAHEQASMIPFGQPILVGHHSEGRDRRNRSRIDGQFRKSFELSKKAEATAARAEAVGTGGISSDDPDALIKLREKLASLEALHTKMKAANRLARKGDRAGLIELGFTEDQADNLLTSEGFHGVGFPAYALSGNNGRMRQVRERIAALEQAGQRQAANIETDAYRYQEDVEDNRIKFFFDGKPSAEVRNVLKGNGFKWSPSRDGQPWVRKYTPQAKWAADAVRKALDAQH